MSCSTYPPACKYCGTQAGLLVLHDPKVGTIFICGKCYIDLYG